MDVIMHCFPTRDAPRVEIEKLYCELINLQRRGEELDFETLDWLDTANTWLISTEV